MSKKFELQFYNTKSKIRKHKIPIFMCTYCCVTGIKVKENPTRKNNKDNSNKGIKKPR